MADLEITRHDSETGGEYRAHPADSDAIGRLTYKKRGDVYVADHTLVPPEIGGRGIAEGVENGRLVVIKGARHLVMMERFNEVCDRIIDFLNE